MPYVILMSFLLCVSCVPYVILMSFLIVCFLHMCAFHSLFIISLHTLLAIFPWKIQHFHALGQVQGCLEKSAGGPQEQVQSASRESTGVSQGQVQGYLEDKCRGTLRASSGRGASMASEGCLRNKRRKRCGVCINHVRILRPDAVVKFHALRFCNIFVYKFQRRMFDESAERFHRCLRNCRE